VRVRSADANADGGRVAQLVAAASRALGLPINRSTVVVHADINSVSRRCDPWPPATREARVKRIIARASAILRPPIVTVWRWRCPKRLQWRARQVLGAR